MPGILIPTRFDRPPVFRAGPGAIPLRAWDYETDFRTYATGTINGQYGWIPGATYAERQGIIAADGLHQFPFAEYQCVQSTALAGLDLTRAWSVRLVGQFHPHPSPTAEIYDFGLGDSENTLLYAELSNGSQGNILPIGLQALSFSHATGRHTVILTHNGSGVYKLWNNGTLAVTANNGSPIAPNNNGINIASDDGNGSSSTSEGWVWESLRFRIEK